MADVEQMFYQVRVPQDDSDMLRYLWWPNGDTAQDLKTYRMRVHVFGATSSPSVASYALKKAANDNEQDHGKRSVPTEEEGIEIASNITALLKNAGFNLTKWLSNSRKLLEAIPVKERAKEVKELDLSHDALPTERTLGVLWHVEEDKIGVGVKDVDLRPTRRNVLSVLSRVYDPIGITSPYVLKAKQILQASTKDKIGWDQDISKQQEKQWNTWLEDLPKIEKIKIERCYKPKDFGNVIDTQLHHFADASQEGYGTVSYLRYVNENQQIHCAFVTAKSRVTSLKTHTIPKLELTAATLAVKQETALRRELNIEISNSTFWSDSQTVLKYINNEKSRYPVFVANRIAIIRESTDPQQWRYCPTKLNPADHASRGLNAGDLTGKTEWLNGPAFLWESEQHWPEVNQDLTETEDRKNEKTEAGTTVCGIQASEVREAADNLIQYYSDWVKLKRAVAWWTKFKEYLQKKLKGADKETLKRECGKITTEDMYKAETAILKYVQRQTFPEYRTLQAGTSHVKKGSSIANLDPVMTKDSLLRVGGRLRHATITEAAKHPIILPKNSHISTLIIQYVHRSNKHQGREHVLAELRQKYWIIKAGVVVKNLVKKCVVCAERCKQL
ncbi:uncharacterized protein [Amphiura filiformis]|uniref:uncharacterized protein n=1 Tax=Amphiura filiformis TaxID=82378 RepID=UPI003B219005